MKPRRRVRLRRRAFRLARWAWWRLPAPVRDRLRPVIFAPAGLASVIRLSRRRLGNGRPVARNRPAAVSPRPLFPTVPETVSVVIPTLDAGPLFARVLGAVGRQTGLGGLELVVIDSGSTDGTRELALAAGARVVDVAPEEFGHGRTRNVGAEATSGEVLLMLVQDAVLLGPNALRALVLELRESPAVAAVSARQIPRSDADLYAAFSVVAHDRFVSSALDGVRRRRFSALTPVQRRAVAGVDNVCAAVRRSAWEALRFADLPFAEDLDFGVRAVGQGWSVRLSRTAAVAHSHTRDAAYQFKRSATDRLHLAPLVGEDRLDRAGEAGPDAVLAAGGVLIEEVQGALSAASPDEAPLVERLASLRSDLAARPSRLAPAGELRLLAEALSAKNVDTGPVVGHLRDALLALLSWPALVEFARAHPSVPGDEAAVFAAKLTASALGRALGDAFRVVADEATAARLLQGV